jgi:hypothetical protein
VALWRFGVAVELHDSCAQPFWVLVEVEAWRRGLLAVSSSGGNNGDGWHSCEGEEMAPGVLIAEKVGEGRSSRAP